jgi:hypothetical protein
MSELDGSYAIFFFQFKDILKKNIMGFFGRKPTFEEKQAILRVDIRKEQERLDKQRSLDSQRSELARMKKENFQRKYGGTINVLGKIGSGLKTAGSNYRDFVIKQQQLQKKQSAKKRTTKRRTSPKRRKSSRAKPKYRKVVYYR